jgi:predicted transcriptional regulator
MRECIFSLAMRMHIRIIGDMSELHHIRTEILKASQRELAAIAGVTQATVSRWETGELEPSRDELSRIRNEVMKRKLRWNDRWFFERPEARAS